MNGTTTAARATADQLAAAVHQNRRLTVTGLLERSFSKLFQGLVYAQIWEDPVADMAALGIAEGEDMVCIASGGCNVMSYLTARPGSVTAVDLSPAHVALLRLKLAAARRLPGHAAFFEMFGHGDRKVNVARYDMEIAPFLADEVRRYWDSRSLRGRRIEMFSRGVYRHGLLGRFLAGVQLLARLTRVDLGALLASPDLAAQEAFFQGRVAPQFDRPFVKWLARSRVVLFGLGIPPAQYEKLAADGGGDVLPVLRERTRKLMCDFPADANYFLWQACRRQYGGGSGGAVPPYLDPAAFPAVREGADRVQAINCSVTDHLAGRPAASVDCTVLLDAQDWMTDAQLDALWGQLTRTARPGARVLFRTGGADDILPGRVAEAILSRWRRDEAASAEAFRSDRSAIYGGVHLYRFEG